MRDHELKCWPHLFTQVITKQKKFEYRLNDRRFQIRDTLWLREWDELNEQYTGCHARVLVLNIWDSENNSIPGLPDQYVIMSVELLQYWENEKEKREYFGKE